MAVKIKIVTTSIGDPDEGLALIEVFADEKRIAMGRVGGEPEDNRIYRDYDWIDGALEAVARACGAEVEMVTTDA